MEKITPQEIDALAEAILRFVGERENLIQAMEAVAARLKEGLKGIEPAAIPKLDRLGHAIQQAAVQEMLWHSSKTTFPN
jgi:hypothetical protein